MLYGDSVVPSTHSVDIQTWLKPNERSEKCITFSNITIKQSNKALTYLLMSPDTHLLWCPRAQFFFGLSYFNVIFFSYICRNFSFQYIIIISFASLDFSVLLLLCFHRSDTADQTPSVGRMSTVDNYSSDSHGQSNSAADNRPPCDQLLPRVDIQVWWIVMINFTITAAMNVCGICVCRYARSRVGVL